MTNAERPDADAIRRQVLGNNYVNTTLKGWAPAEPVLELLENTPWGFLWPRDELTLRERSLITVGILAALDRTHELRTHIRGARRNGCTFEEIVEAILHAGVYSGMPAAVEGAKVAQAIAQEEQQEADPGDATARD
ncbi:carboxymuconolactone decarboxylase family protein [Propionimicrobium sp. PCR01-08-3]|uniref:carboxymuconolactone decarboxylase family protein n=1 Tax=Propionimicrobium sp. PCR01-08-3 TaxID=3052086 RepID=UPI00255D14E0|nr:carboxymuconolactone decarboxylase family protein [Propionimicrobium sp. PCR01-08-3]WIY82022.1 carboxymuconolactone decarboxylase family protein [Propionimicrobium sp. PCR01-08-3]